MKQVQKKQSDINGKRAQPQKLKKLLRPIIVVILMGLLVFSLIKLVLIGVSYLRNRRAYHIIRENNVVSEVPVQTAAVTAAGEIPDVSEPAVTPEPLPFIPDWAQLKTVCPDIVGWLYLEGTNIHYPVVQCTDNAFYLDHNARQEKNDGGALFLDAYCDAQSQNLLIYGHRMKDDSMFGQLPNYADKNYLASHPVMYYLTPEQNYRVKIFACRTVKAEAKYFSSFFSTGEEYRKYQEKAVEQSYWAAPVSPDTGYKMLTLSTCSVYRGMNDPRLLVHGLLIPMH